MRSHLLVSAVVGAWILGTACGVKSPVVLDAGCEDCECTPGAIEACYPGPEGTEGVSTCVAGQRTCDEASHFGPCLGAVIPAAELCNGLDDDCDVAVDEDFADEACGVGACRVTVATCADGGTVTCEPLRPAVREFCEGTDDDCDGEVDEGCACLDGRTQPCFSGAPDVRGIGRCTDGLQTCATGTWGACAGEVLPGTEQCNAADDDCDGQTDESDPLLGAACSTGLLGVCAAGTNACTTGQLTCVQTLQPVAEACNGRDDNCDGQADEGSPDGGLLCTTGLAGVCSKGVTVCQSESVICVPEIPSSPELCDGLDNDCDGISDEGNPGSGQACSTGLLGVCSAGTTNCSAGVLQCVQTQQPSAEACNGEDDDCDGQVDDSPMGVGQVCTTALPGVCSAGVTVCSNGAASCQQSTQASAEVCNALDDDCDGTVNDGNPGGGAACSTGLPGICAAGLTNCSSGVITCQQSAQSSAETCDGQDNDCDGASDEGNPGGSASCTTGQPGVCAAGTTLCSGGQLQCNPNTPSSAETCDGLDNDCDGTVDDGNPGGGAACTTAQPGVCSAGLTSCAGGVVGCVQTLQSSSELCDSLDNDCDGQVDEGNPGGGGACSTGLLGACSAGTMNCSSGTLQCSQNQMPSAEVCNGLDDDCDGQVDDSPMGAGQACTTGLLGVCSAGVTVCSGGVPSCQQTTLPSAEVCNALDDDCDGTINDGNPGGGAACSTGLPGICAPGLTACTGGFISCQQTAASSAETCDGLDNDCDATTDEGNPGGGLACTTGQLGVCSPGTTVCSGGAMQCTPNTPSSAEICDGLDNDCDGTSDDGNPGGGNGCTTGLLGVCGPGVTACSGGVIGCAQTVLPSSEICDAKDNDCDGSTDEGNPGGGGACSTGLQGVCGAGTAACTGGVVVCNQNTTASAESCDGADNDCDGTTDEGNPGGGLACNTGLSGQCAAGTTVCSGGAVQCLPNTPASAEVCDGADNDCDGTVDDGNPGGNTSCSTGLAGECAAGVTQCTAGAVVCQQTQTAVAEVCDGKDNDCDATTDEGNPGGGVACSTGLLGVCATGTTTCSGGVLLCPQNQMPSAETCDLEDDDCDGQIDEDFDLTKDPGNCGVCGNVCGTVAGGLCCNSTCVTPGVNNCGACGLSCASGTVVVNELLIDPNATGDSQGEWFELYNPGTVAIDLRGFVVKDLALDTHTINSATPVMVPAGGYAVLGVNANTGTNGGVTVAYQFSGVALGNSGDELIIEGHGVELDRVVWPGTFDVIGTAKELSISHRTAALNDTLTNWCNATTPFGLGDLGTPGAANVCAK